MIQTITVRHRIGGDEPFSPFSARNFRDLSSGIAVGSTLASGFAESQILLSGATLAQCVYLSGQFRSPALCSGLGRCGLCRVRFISPPPPVLDAEKSVLSHHDLDASWRLACCHVPKGGEHILVPALPVASLSALSVASTKREGRYGLAVDLGTTSIHWRGVALDEGEAGDGLPHGVMTNPQMGAGSDVVSRIAYAATEDGAETLRRLVVDALVDIVATCATEGVCAEEVCIAANPAMTGILLGYDTRSLAHAPCSLPCAGNAEVRVSGLPPLYVPPQISAFVGGDISAGYASLALDPDMAKPEYPFLLADLGTNGECVLALSPGEALAASLPMGPALEGINLAFGSMAIPGAVTEYTLTPHGLDPVVMGGTAPVGITATGYLSLLRILRASNLVTESGLFAYPKDVPLAGRIGAGENGENGEKSLRLPGKMALYASDVEELLKVKAAFSLAVSQLLQTASLSAAKISRFYFAGALGLHVSADALISLGFVPPGIGKRIVPVGNTSLAGASLFLQRKATREACALWAETVTTLDLTANAAFGKSFAEHMVFAWKHP